MFNMARLGRWTTRLLSAALLGLLLVGTPYALVTQLGWPLPRHLPTTMADLEQALTTPVTDQLVLNLLAVAIWILWLTFTASVVTEIPARARGLRARRLPGLAPVQTIAGWLLSGVTAGVIAAATITPALAPPTPTPDPAATTIMDLPTHPLLAVAAASSPTDPQHPAPDETELPARCADENLLVVDEQRYAYVVQRDDSLWAIAERCLDDGNQWPQIWELNQHRSFPDVGGSLHTPDLIYPGWDLRLPIAAPPEPPTAPPAAEPASAPPPAAASTPPTTAPSTPVDEGHHHDEPAPSDEREDHPPTQVALPLTAALATAGIFAALLLARLRYHRRRRLPQRRLHQHLPEPDPAAETDVRTAAQPADVTRLDHGLRSLAHSLRGRAPDQLPDIIAGWLDHQTLHLLLTQPCPDPPPPYQATGNNTWTLPAAAPLPHLDGQLAPLPALVTIASHSSGQHLTVDLERTGLLSITGDHQRRLDLLRYLAAELATSQWVDDLELVLVGFSLEDTEHLITLDEQRVHAAISLADALARVQRRIDANTAALTDSDAHDSFAGRVNDIIADAWMPHLLLIADPTTDLTPLDTQLRDTGRCAVAVAAITDTATTWNVHVRADGRLHIDWLSINDAIATRLPADQLARLASLLDTARNTLAPADETATAPASEPVPAADEPWADGTDQHGHLLAEHTTEPEPAADAPPADDAEPADADPSLHTGTAERNPDMTSTTAIDKTISPHEAVRESPEQLRPVLSIAPPPTLRRKPTTTPPHRRRRAPADPDLDTDLRDWHAPHSQRPRIAILGPVTINAPGQPPTDRIRFYSEIIVYLATRGTRGATADVLDHALWPEGITNSSRRVAMTKARRWLGEDTNGQQWLPPNLGTNHGYRINNGYLFDWHLFRRLRTRGETRGTAGANDLRRALELVRGAPLDNADRPHTTGRRNPYSWLPTSGIQPHHLASAIVDTAHQLVNLQLEAGDTTTARWAVEQAWLADPDRLDDHPWLDLMRIHHTNANANELRTLIQQLIQTREVEILEDLSPATYQEINRLAGNLLLTN